MGILTTVAAMSAAAYWSFCSFRTAQSSSEEFRLAFTAMGCGAALDVVAHLVSWGIPGVIEHQAISPDSPGALFALGAVICVIVASVDLLHTRISVRISGILDAVIMLAATTFFSWVFILRPVYDAIPGGTVAKIAGLIFPALNIVFLVLAGQMSLRIRRNRLLGVFLLLATIPILIANVAFAYIAETGTFHLGTPVDLGYILTYFLAGIMANHSAELKLGHSVEPRITLAYVYLPYLPVAIAGIAFTDLLITHRPFDPILITSGIVLVLAGYVRQTLVISENMVLNRRLQESEEQFRHMALHDSLTGLPNRALFQDRAIQLSSIVARRSGEELIIFYLDLNSFKEINDTHGHAVGDEVLKAVALRILATIRKSDTAARLGGDEFAIVMMADRNTADMIAQRIIRAIEKPLPIHRKLVLTISTSIGRAAQLSDESIESLLMRADEAMYEAKTEFHRTG